MKMPAKFSDFCSEFGVEMNTMQKRAANALLSRLDKRPASGKSFLMHWLTLFVHQYGSEFELEDDVKQGEAFEKYAAIIGSFDDWTSVDKEIEEINALSKRLKEIKQAALKIAQEKS